VSDRFSGPIILAPTRTGRLVTFEPFFKLPGVHVDEFVKLSISVSVAYLNVRYDLADSMTVAASLTMVGDFGINQSVLLFVDLAADNKPEILKAFGNLYIDVGD
jgi:hypothetical protein